MRLCVSRVPDSVTRGGIGEFGSGRRNRRAKFSSVCVEISKLAPMPSAEMRRSEGVRVLRSGRKLKAEFGGSKIKESGKATDGHDLIRLIDDSNEAKIKESAYRSENGAGDKGRDLDTMIIDDVEIAYPHLELPSRLIEGVLPNKRFGIVYSRKRKRSNLKVISDEKRFGLHFFQRKRRRVVKTSVSLEKYIDGFVESGVVSVTVDPYGRSYGLAGVVNSVLRYIQTAKLGLVELSGFLQSQPFAGVFASHGIRFLLNQSSNQRSGFCNIYGAGEFTSLFDLNFSCVPVSFVWLHARMWFRSLRLSSLLLMNGHRTESTDEDDSELDDIIQCTSSREHSLNCSFLGLDESSNLGGLKMLNAPVEVSRPSIRGLPYKNGVVTRSSERRRKRSMRTRKARHPSFLGVHRNGSSLLDSGIKKNGVRYSSSVLTNNETRKSVQKKSSSGDIIKVLKSNLLALGKDIASVSCSVNLLVVESDRCYRESGAYVTLELSTSNEWILAIRKDGSLIYYHRAQKGEEVKPSCTNRFTLAIMWYVEAGWKLEFTDRNDWAIFKELFKVCGDRNIVSPSPANAIPIPGVCEVSVCDISNDDPYVRPESYIKMNDDELSRIFYKKSATYDMDCEDEEWLNSFNNDLDLEDDRSVHVTDVTFELMIDSFEKAAFRSSDKFIGEETPKDLCMVEFASRDVVEAVYSYWVAKRKQKRGPLLGVFQLNEPKKTPVVAKPVLRKKRSMKQRHSHTAKATLSGRGKELRVLQAIAAESNANEEKTAMLEVEQARAAATNALEAAVAKRRRAQALMASADLAVYRAAMAIRIAEAAQTAEPDQAIARLMID